ncbi:Flp family type IVb pilin [Stutzerimonas kirkiae]|nr:Flp family type IVb pilin [Stutzerimonas kirkiae]
MKDFITLCYMKGKLFLKREDGASAIEYGIIAGLISIVIIGAASAVGTDLAAIFERIKDGIAAWDA